MDINLFNLDFNTSEYFFFTGTIFLSLIYLKKRKWILAISIFLVGCLWLASHESLRNFIQNLGGDSFAEVEHFDWKEAIFWLSTVKQYISLKYNIIFFLCYIVLAACAVLVLRGLAKNARLNTQDYLHIKSILALIMIILAIHQTVYGAIKFFYQNAKELVELKQNFTNPLPKLISNHKPINILVYIGESTTSMNMEVYGYPRNTTPNLKQFYLTDPNFILFNNVFSTHTATSFSLLEALSLAADNNNRFLPINQRKRCSLVSILNNAQLKTKLFSTQNSSGSFNLASATIFGEALKNFSINTGRLGNNLPKNRIWDHDFFINSIINQTPFSSDAKTLTFFHSYAGHGSYLNNIPIAFRKKVDNFFYSKDSKHILGAKTKLKDMDVVENYDSAVKYIDFSLAKAINFVKNSRQPAVLIYFSDHGESPYTNSGHDISHFMPEMIRIPFLLYFNAAAKTAYPEVFTKYKILAATKEIATLAQLPNTIFDILGVRIADKDKNKVISTAVIGEKTFHQPILVRDLARELNFINLNQEALIPGPNYQKNIIDKTDAVTKIFVANHGKKARIPRITPRDDMLIK